MKKGFTLLELIVVVIIIGILAMIALPRFIRVAEKARSAEGRMLLDAIRSAQFRYYAEHENYTNAIGDLDLTYSTPNYFNTITAVNNATTNLGSVTRSASNSYLLNIDYNGMIRCYPGGVSPAYNCSDAGF